MRLLSSLVPPKTTFTPTWAPDEAIAVGVPARVVKMRGSHPGPPASFFTPEESALVSALAALIVPSDATGPGAPEADVGHTLERWVASSRYRREFYSRRLLAFDRCQSAACVASSASVRFSSGVFRKFLPVVSLMWIGREGMLWSRKPGQLRRSAA